MSVKSLSVLADQFNVFPANLNNSILASDRFPAFFSTTGNTLELSVAQFVSVPGLIIEPILLAYLKPGLLGNQLGLGQAGCALELGHQLRIGLDLLQQLKELVLRHRCAETGKTELIAGKPAWLPGQRLGMGDRAMNTPSVPITSNGDNHPSE